MIDPSFKPLSSSHAKAMSSSSPSSTGSLDPSAISNLLARLDEKKVGFRCLDQAIDTTSSTGRLTLSILGAVAAFELDIRAERQREGIEAAKKRGVYQGRRSNIDLDKVRQLSTRMKPPEIAAVMGISRASAYRALSQIAAEAA